MTAKFAHLHVHSHYSLLDGLAKVPALVARAKELKMGALALTDHGVMYGAVEFYVAAKDLGLKPIIGLEAYVASGDHRSKTTAEDRKRSHLLLLAKNNAGYENLIKLTTKAHLEGFYYKPRIDKALLKQHAEGLIGTSSCLSSDICRAIRHHKIDLAETLLKEYLSIFAPGDFYIELQYHQHMPVQQATNAVLLELAQKYKLPIIATNDVHYVNSDDAETQDVLMAIQTKKDLDDEKRLSMRHDDFSMFSPEKMAALFKDVPQALETTAEIVKKCNVELALGETHLPYFEAPKTETHESFLKRLCYEGLTKRYGFGIKKLNGDWAIDVKKAADPALANQVSKRLNYELSVITKTGFIDYFLIVQDLVNWAKNQGIVVGPGRGSAAGSLVSYLLNITNLDPLKYELIFERFLNPERIEPPDIDLDFTDVRRDEVIEYARSRYGRDNVAQIITFGTMAARAAVRDVGRVLGYEYGYCDRLAKMVPFGLTLEKALAQAPEFRTLYQTDEQARRLIDIAKRLEGVARHASTHACGVVITKEPLDKYTPRQFPPTGENTVVTQYEMHSVMKLGLLKMDLLGLKNLTIIENTLRIIKKLHGLKIDLDALPLADAETFGLLQAADTTGIFQLESEGIRRYLKQLKPTELEDIIAMVALYRPGPMELIPTYVARKHGLEKITYLHPNLEPILKKTYGIMVYQEQLLEAARAMAGFTLAEADILRKAVGKKIKKLLQEQKNKLLKGMAANKIPRPVALEFWKLIEPFDRYGFNRCLTGDAKIIDAESGSVTSLKELFKNKNRKIKTFSLTSKLELESRPVTEVYYNGKKPVFLMKTRSGRSIKTTANHPFLTENGWRRLDEITIGARIATPRRLPGPQKPIKVAPHKLALLGYLLAEGNLCHPNGFYFYSNSQTEIDDYCRSLETFENTVAKIDGRKPAIAVYAKRKNISRPSAAVRWIESLGLKYKKATAKFFPDFVYQLGNDDLSLILGKMFQGDGCLNLKRKDPQIFYATSSSAIAFGIQHLLLRLGILSSVHRKKFKYRNTIKIGFTVNINRYDNIKKFIEALSKHFVGEMAPTAEKVLTTHPILNGTLNPWAARGSYDTVPVTLVRNELKIALQGREVNLSGLAQKIGIAERLFWSDARKIGYLRETVGQMAQGLNNQKLGSLADSDIYWDTIVKIEPAGIKDTYDLTVADTHNFIANDLIVHNSHAACYALIAYQTAYLKAHYPTEFMTALLNSRQNDVEEIAFLIDDARRQGITVQAPDINESLTAFTMTGNKTIRFGLAAIKNVGEKIVDLMIKERQKNGPYKTFANFIERVKVRDLNKKSLEALIKAGAFDALEERGRLLANLDRIIRTSQEIKQEDASQPNLFGVAAGTLALNLKLDEAPPASASEKLAWEKELLGLFISDNPLRKHQAFMAKHAVPIEKILAASEAKLKNRTLRIAGHLEQIRRITTKAGEPMLFVKVRDETAAMEAVVFPKVLAQFPNVWVKDAIVIFQGQCQKRHGEYNFVCEKAKRLT